MNDHMKEAERLLDEYIRVARLWIVQNTGEAEMAARAALLAHIQRGAPEGWKLVPVRLPMETEMRPVIARLARAAESGQVILFDDFWSELLAAAPDHFRDAAEMVADPAEVPMPEPDVTALWNYTDSAGEQHSLAYTHDQMRTYGAACRAAGEAAGYARGLKEAGQDADRQDVLRMAFARFCKTQGWSIETIKNSGGNTPDGRIYVDPRARAAWGWESWRASLYGATLRGEVKP